MPALYSITGEADSAWCDVDLLGAHKSGRLVVRETGRFYRGVFLAERHQVAVLMAEKTP